MASISHPFDRIMPRKPTSRTERARYQKHTVNPSGTHNGGSCLGCGKPITYWLHYQLCDACVILPPYACRPTGYDMVLSHT